MLSPPQSRISSPHRYAPGEVIAAKYRLEQALGEGGMGTVWRAINLQLDAPVALKLIRSELDREVLTPRLKQEARATARLGHPGIVRVFDVGESQFGDPFIVMELLTGRSLADLLAEESRLGAVRAVQLLLPVAEALVAAHAKGIIHRDLKPDNVFVAVEDERVQPKLVDFGIVKLADGARTDLRLTREGAVLGSPEYMSPEQARGLEDLDQRSDVWSFAVVLYECLAGATPFAGTNYNGLLRSIVEDEPRSLLDHLACDRPLWEIVRRGLAKDPNKRFGSMLEFGGELASWSLAQGVFEDITGGALEVKWIARGSDPRALRVSRASFASLSGLQQESGVRAFSPATGGAPTVGLPVPPDLTAAAATATGIRAPLGRSAQIALGVVVALALALGLLLVFRQRPGEPAAFQAAPAPVVAEAHAPVGAEPLLSAALAPSPPPLPTSAVATATLPVAPRPTGRAEPTRVAPRSAETKSRAAGTSAAASDLMSPY